MLLGDSMQTWRRIGVDKDSTSSLFHGSERSFALPWTKKAVMSAANINSIPRRCLTGPYLIKTTSFCRNYHSSVCSCCCKTARKIWDESQSIIKYSGHLGLTATGIFCLALHKNEVIFAAESPYVNKSIHAKINLHITVIATTDNMSPSPDWRRHDAVLWSRELLWASSHGSNRPKGGLYVPSEAHSLGLLWKKPSNLFKPRNTHALVMQLPGFFFSRHQSNRSDNWASQNVAARSRE